jgi:outer membrane protein assembly factor BamA
VTESLFENGNRIAEVRSRDTGIGLDIGFSLNRWSEVRAGYEARGTSASIQTGNPVLPPRDGRFRSAFLRWVYEGYDRPVIPTRGLYARAETRWFSDEPDLVADLVRSELEVAAFQPVSPRASIFARAAAGRTFLRDALPVQEFALGGAARMSAWNRGEFRDGRFALLSLGYIRNLGALPPFFGDRLYAAGFYEAGRLFSAANPESVLHDFALALGTRSPLGALWLGGAWGEGGETRVFFRIGRLF